MDQKFTLIFLQTWYTQNCVSNGVALQSYVQYSLANRVRAMCVSTLAQQFDWLRHTATSSDCIAFNIELTAAGTAAFPK